MSIEAFLHGIDFVLRRHNSVKKNRLSPYGAQSVGAGANSRQLVLGVNTLQRRGSYQVQGFHWTRALAEYAGYGLIITPMIITSPYDAYPAQIRAY